jgi:phytoene synthase
LLLPLGSRNDAGVVYAFCRLVDDLVDEAPSPEEGRAALLALRWSFAEGQPKTPLTESFIGICARLDIPHKVVFDLMDGVNGDADTVRFETNEELIQYSYRVAGTVGLMMARVVGVTEDRMLPFAIDLGIGMQLTNICRDVLEDAEKGRVYLPEIRLTQKGSSPEALLSGAAKPAQVSAVVQALLEMAETYYLSGFRGLHGIPFRARTSILAALMMYREIGRKLARNGANPLKGRTIVGPWKKIWLVGLAVVTSPFIPWIRKHTHQSSLHSALPGINGADPAQWS